MNIFLSFLFSFFCFTCILFHVLWFSSFPSFALYILASFPVFCFVSVSTSFVLFLTIFFFLFPLNLQKFCVTAFSPFSLCDLYFLHSSSSSTAFVLPFFSHFSLLCSISSIFLSVPSCCAEFFFSSLLLSFLLFFCSSCFSSFCPPYLLFLFFFLPPLLSLLLLFSSPKLFLYSASFTIPILPLFFLPCSLFSLFLHSFNTSLCLPLPFPSPLLYMFFPTYISFPGHFFLLLL